jgi:hypothetical protein
MKNVPYTNIAIYIIFFGTAFLEAAQSHSWEAALFGVLGVMSLWADLRVGRDGRK